MGAAASFYIKRNDTYPPIIAILSRNGSAIDLTGATVRFHMGNVVDAEAEILDDEGGQVQYSWQEGDTKTAGGYDAEFEVTDADGKVETFPQSGYIGIVVAADLA